MNNVVLVGRLARDPELRTVNTMNGTNTTCSFTIAVSRQFSNQNGERDADFINCVIWGKQAETYVNIVLKVLKSEYKEEFKQEIIKIMKAKQYM